MLSDSKVREAGFIRTSSSRKILYQPEPQLKNHSSDDSFSSFQYESTEKISIQNVEKSFGRNTQLIEKKQSREKQQKSYDSVARHAAQQLPPHIPKPAKRPMYQPSFQNQRLKNNFFQQPQKAPTNHPSKQLPRSTTPYFTQSSMKQDLKQVNDICNRIGNMKLEGNFSFNPKMNNRLVKDKSMLNLQSDDQREGEQRIIKGNKSSLAKRVKAPEPVVKKAKQNNYFSNSNNTENRFQYDFESSSSDDQADQREQSQQYDHKNYQHDAQRDQIVRYYEQQQRQRTEPEVMAKTRPQLTSPNNIGRISNHQIFYPPNQPHSQKTSNYSRRIQNQQSSQDEQQLITQYNKDDFGTKVPAYMKGRNQQLAENQGYQNMTQPQQGMIATNGGVCFSVDVKQFNQNGLIVESKPVRRGNMNQKKKKANDREEILKRREMAKIYSKQARFRLFGFA